MQYLTLSTKQDHQHKIRYMRSYKVLKGLKAELKMIFSSFGKGLKQKKILISFACIKGSCLLKNKPVPVFFIPKVIPQLLTIPRTVSHAEAFASKEETQGKESTNTNIQTCATELHSRCTQG